MTDFTKQLCVIVPQLLNMVDSNEVELFQCDDISDEKMSTKSYRSLDAQIRIPHLESIIKIEGSVFTINEEQFQVTKDVGDMMKCHRRKTRGSNSSAELCLENLTSDCVTEIENVSSSTEISCNGVVEKTLDDYYKECYRIFGELGRAVVRIPCMRTGELKGGVPIVKVNDEVFRVAKETKEQVEMSNNVGVSCANIINEEKNTFKKEFNSASIFFEKEEKIFDRTYFQVLSTETFGENEICVSGMFVDESL